MNAVIQEGIYYGQNMRPGKSLCILFLRIGNGSTASEIGNLLGEVWMMLQDLKKGNVRDLKGLNETHWFGGNLSVLIGYNKQIFTVQGVRRKMPAEFQISKKFSSPLRRGGGSVIDDSRVTYADDITENHAASEDIMIQFVGDNEFITTRAVVETCKMLTKMKNVLGDHALHTSKIYTGHQRDDGRSWLGFHDGVSNLASKERLEAIAVNSQELIPDDRWLVNGTYLAFMRIEINVDEWDKIQKESQEIIIGRDKINGCPLVSLVNGKPVRESKCPIRGTYEVVDKGNEIFRQALPQKSAPYVGMRSYSNDLKYSHISRANPTDPSRFRKSGSYHIFRQGFEFFEPTEFFPGYRLGLNFISFQNSPSKIFSILQEGFGRNIYEGKNFRPLEDFFSVRSAGIFLVPPKEGNELFPGVSLFLDNSALQPRSSDKIRSWSTSFS